MQPVKIAFFDIDGTLIDPATERISPKTVEMLNRLEEKGIRRVIVTGRPIASLPDFGNLRFDAMATSTGGFCYCGDEVIFEAPIDPKEVQQLIQNGAALGRPVSVAIQERLVANGWEADLAEYYRMAGLTLSESEDFDEAIQNKVYQVMLAYRPGDEETILQGTENLKMALSWSRACDVVSAHGGKGKAVEHILRYFGLKKEDSVAFGDSQNDLEMMVAAGCGVAMGNGSDQIKAVADEICRPVSEDGIYHYFLEKGII
jgi:Cof subfamily protein (haloacid dehalogenase superfamily)